MTKIKRTKRHYPGIALVTPTGLSGKEAKAYTRNLIKEYDEAGKGLKGFEKEGIKLMNKLLKIMDEMEKKDLEGSVYMLRQAEFMVASWLNSINPHVKYKISK
jgi:hypothetical protein